MTLDKTIATSGRPAAYRTFKLVAFIFIGHTSVLGAPARRLPLAPESAVWLDGDSTLHPFTSRTTQMQLTAEVDPTTGPAPAEANDVFGAILKQQALKQFDLSIPVKGLKSKDSALDKNMYKALKAEECPSIDFHMTRYAVGVATSSAPVSPVRAWGTLRAACHEQPVELEAALARDQNVLRIRGQYPLLMTDYGVKPPTMMMGTIKVKNPVMIHFDLRLDVNPK